MSWPKRCAGGVIVLALAIAAPATAANFPQDNRIRMLEYHENDVYTIDTLYGYQSNIEFEEGEEIQTISVGDRSLWQMIPSGRRLFIRPMDENVSTNMTVITNLRAYQFEIRAGKGTPEENPRLIYVAKFIYPGSKNFPMAASVPAPVFVPAPITPAPISAPVNIAPAPTSVPERGAQRKTQTNTSVSPPMVMPPPPSVVPKTVTTPYVSPTPVPTAKHQRNYLYSFSGKDDLAPTDVYDDGVSTYFSFPSSQAAPKIYRVRSNGEKQLTPYVVTDGVAKASVVAERWMIEYAGNTNVVLYNESQGQLHDQAGR